jgi:hypothetical protein
MTRQTPAFDTGLFGTARGFAHTWVIAAFPALSLYSASLSTFPLPIDTLDRLVAVSGAVAACLILALRPVTSSLRHAAVMASLFLAGAQSFLLSATFAVGAWLRRGWPDWLLVTLHLAAGVWLGLRASKPERATRLAAPAEIGAVVILLATGAQALLSATGLERPEAAISEIRAEGTLHLSSSGPRPDIIHLMFDGLGSPGTLKTHFGVDAAGTIARLEAREYTVGTEVMSNYVHTYSSVASLMNGAYLTPLRVMEGHSDRRPLRTLIEESTVITALKTAGYDFRFLGSSYSATDRHAAADETACEDVGLNELETAVYRFSVLRGFNLTPLTYGWFRSKIRCQLEGVISVPDTGPPRYVFAHLIFPHPPFAFGPSGEPAAEPRPLFGMQDADEFPGSPDAYRQGYRDQARYALKTIDDLSAALARRKRPYIAIIHGDHGPGSRFSHEDMARSDLRERFGVFLALKPSGKPLPLPSTLVNVFRIALASSFTGKVDLLPDRHYYTTFSAPYRFHEWSPDTGLTSDGR